MPRAPRKWTLEETKEIQSSSDGIDKLRRCFRTNQRTIKLIKEATSEEDALAIPKKNEESQVPTADITGKESSQAFSPSNPAIILPQTTELILLK